MDSNYTEPRSGQFVTKQYKGCHRATTARLAPFTAGLFDEVWKRLPDVAHCVIGDRLERVDNEWPDGDDQRSVSAMLEITAAGQVLHFNDRQLSRVGGGTARWTVACQLALVYLGCLHAKDDRESVYQYGIKQAMAWGFPPDARDVEILQ